MNLSWLSRNRDYCLKIAFGLFVVLYASLFLISPALGPTDDFVFLRTLQSGKPLLYFSQDFPYYDTANIGRFSLLASMEYNLVGFFSNSSFWYFFYHSIQFIVFAFLFVKILKKIIPNNKLLIYGSFAILVFLPAFTISWFRLQLPERNLLFLFVCFLLSYWTYLETSKKRYFWFSLLFANIAIYYKEIGFTAMGAFSFFYLVFSWKNSHKKIKLLNILLMASSALYLILYYVIIYSQKDLLILKGGSHSILTIAKIFINYAFFSDPFLMLILIPFVLWRTFRIIIKRENASPLFDSMLWGATAYALTLLILNMYGTYYLLPAYAFAIPAIIYFFKKGNLKGHFWKIMLAITAFIMVFNTLPAGLYYLTYNKYLPVNLNKTVDFVIKDMKNRYPNAKPTIFMDGSDLVGGRATYFIFGEFMNHKGFDYSKFDMKSNTPTEHPEPLLSKIIPPLTVFESDKVYEIKSGDYLIIPPQATTKNISQEYLDSLKKDYDLIFKTRSDFAFPNMNLKILVKNLIAGNDNGLVKNKNTSQSLDYYVFIKK